MLVRSQLGVIALSAALFAGLAGSAWSSQGLDEAGQATSTIATSAIEHNSALAGIEMAFGTDTPIQAVAEERALADIARGSTAFILTPSRDVVDIPVSLPNEIHADGAWLRLAARPASDLSNGRISVRVNNGDPIVIRPQARAMEARFALYSADFRPGDNTLSISYAADTADAGWIVDAERSSLRLSLQQTGSISSLEALESNLSADFAAPRRIALISEAGDERAAMEGLVAQGLALRAGVVPLLSGDVDSAELVVRMGAYEDLNPAEQSAVDAQLRLAGPALVYMPARQPRLILTGRNRDEATAAARLFAARSLAGFDQSFAAADAVSAARLGQGMPRDARAMVGANADLRTFATSGLPFSADQGSRTAVILSGNSEEDRFGALSILARSALISEQAWLYAWYGESDTPAPGNHNLLVLGPGADMHPLVQRFAPSEMHAAMRAAERSQGQRGLMRLAAAAYADGPENGNDESINLGVASLFSDTDGRWIGALTTTAVGSFETAGRSLARSDLWGSLEGRAVIWSERGVTVYDYSVAAPTLQDRWREFALDHTRDLAFVMFGLAFLILIRGIWRRRVHRSSNA